MRLRSPVFAALLAVLLSALAGTALAAAKVREPLAVGVAFDEEGRLWRTRVVDGVLVVDVSEDRGTSFGATVRVAAEPVAADGELRPEIFPADGGRVYVAWTSPLTAPYAGNIRFSRSTNGGRSFEAPLTVNDNREAITHRFQSLHVAKDGRITLAWIDKREGEAAKRAGRDYRGAAIYYATSEDGGASFGTNARLAAHTCECCRIALTSDTDGRPVAFWRHVFADGTRDHALGRVDPLGVGTEPQRSTDQRWQINACPHHGPALAVAADGTRHGAWFNQAAGEPGLYYGNWTAHSQASSQAMRFGSPNAGHPALLVQGARVLLAWKAFDGERTIVSLMESSDGGKTWAAARTVAAAEDASDHPQLVAYRDAAYLSWSSLREGHRLVPLTAPKESAR